MSHLSLRSARPHTARRSVLAGGVALAMLVGISTPTSAATSNIRISKSAPRAQASAPSAAFDPETGRHLVVWTSTSAAGKSTIRGRFLNGDGRPEGSGFAIASAGDRKDLTTDAIEPTVVHHAASGRFLVAYAADADEDTGGLASDFRIRVRAVSSTNGALSAPTVISASSDDNDSQVNARQPALAVNTDTGQVLAVWEDDESDRASAERSDRYEIHGRMLDVSRTGEIEKDSTELVFSTTGTGGDTSSLDARAPAVAYNASLDRFLVVWDSEHTGDSISGIVGQLLDGDGTAIGGDVAIDEPSGLDFNSAVVATSTGFTVAWERDDDLVWRDLVVTDDVLLPDGPDVKVPRSVTGDAVRTPAAAAITGDSDVYLVWASTDNRAVVRGLSVRTDDIATTISDHPDAGSISSAVSRPTLSLGARGRLLVAWSGVSPTVNRNAQIWVDTVKVAGEPAAGNRSDSRITETAVSEAPVARATRTAPTLTACASLSRTCA